MAVWLADVEALKPSAVTHHESSRIIATLPRHGHGTPEPVQQMTFAVGTIEEDVVVFFLMPCRHSSSS